jgi:hypothetical protein
MTVRRGFLYFGVFLVAAGGVTLLTTAGVLDKDAVADALRLWPLAVIAIGAGLLLRRTRAAVPGGVVAAAVPGLMLGAMFVAVPHLSAPCADFEAPAGQVSTRSGDFGSRASVDLSISCGELHVTTASGSAWRLDATSDGPRHADVTSNAGRLSVTSDDGGRFFHWNPGADAWTVVLPTDPTVDLDVTVNAGKGGLDLSGMHLDRANVDVNAGDMELDFRGATVSRLTMDVNAAAASVTLPATGDLTGDLSVNAGSLQLCAPADLGLRVRANATLGATHFNGLVQRGSAWESPSYATAPFHADVSVSASVGSVDVNPEGGCK